MTKNKNDGQRYEHDDDELVLADLLNIMKRQKKWVLGFPLAATLCALVFVLLIPPEWEVAGVIQIGQVWQYAVDGQKLVESAPRIVESAPRTVERMKLESFAEAVLNSLKVPASEDNPVAQLYRKSLKVKLLPNTDLIEVHVRGHSRDEARNFLDATLAQLRAAHERIAQPSIERMKMQLEEVKRDLKVAQDARTQLVDNVLLKQKIAPGDRFSENVLLANILTSKDAEIREHQQRKLVLEEQINPLRTYPTSFLGDIYVPDKAAFPKRGLTLVLALFLGLFAGIIFALIRDRLTQEKSIATAGSNDY